MEIIFIFCNTTKFKTFEDEYNTKINKHINKCLNKGKKDFMILCDVYKINTNYKIYNIKIYLEQSYEENCKYC